MDKHYDKRTWCTLRKDEAEIHINLFKNDTLKKILEYVGTEWKRQHEKKTVQLEKKKYWRKMGD